MKTFTETVRDSADIVRVVSEYVALKGAGNALKGLCPFHSEKTPSFTVNREKQLFHCFGCKAGGDVFEFVKQSERVSFPEAVRIVAEKCGVPVPLETGAGDKAGEARKQLFETCERASAYFQKMLASDEAGLAREMLAKRAVNDVFSTRFGLGYAPSGGLLAHLKPKDPLSTGLFVKNERGEVYDRFRRRLIFPIADERGRTIGFGGRAFGDIQPKYLNSAESPLYSKSYVLYGLHLARDAARRAERIVVVEGYFDCLSLHQNGIENVVASCGTSLTAQQVQLMARYVPEVVMNYDPDAAGQNAMKKSLELLLSKGLRVRVLKLPNGLDPDDFVRKEGGEVYRRLLASAPYFWQYLIADAGRRYDLQQPEMKGAAVREVLADVAKIQDRVERLEVAKSVAESFKVPENLILESLNLTARRPEPGPVRRANAPKAAVHSLSEAEKQLIQALGQNEGVFAALEPILDREFWRDAWSWPVLERLIRNPREIERALEGIADEELVQQVRAAIVEQPAGLTMDHVFASVQKLNDVHLVRKEKEIREQLKQLGSEGAPPELMQRKQDIVAERTRVAEALKPRG